MRPSPPDETPLATTAEINPNAVEASHDDALPDTPVEVLVQHARRLARRVRIHWPALRVAKVDADAAAKLDAGASWLRECETRWNNLRVVARGPSLADARAAMLTGRDDLFQAARTFCEDDADVQRVLDDVAGVDGDDDALRDCDRLLAVYDEQKPCFDGTDLTPARVKEIREAVETFRDLRAGRGTDASDGAEGLSKEARDALKMRNRAFWFVANIERRVCKRGQYIFRKSPAEASQFTTYVTEYQSRSRRRRAPEGESEGGKGDDGTSGGTPPA